MEGLIPFVIHAIKKNRKLSKYRSLSDDDHDDDGGKSIEMSRDGSSRRHGRTRSEFHPPPPPPPPMSAVGSSGFGPSRSLREDPNGKADYSYGRRA